MASSLCTISAFVFFRRKADSKDIRAMVVRSIIIVEQVLYFQVNDFDNRILGVLAAFVEGFEQEFLCHLDWI